MKNVSLAKRVFYATLGVFILSLGAALLRVGNVGLDPYSSANLTIGVHLLHLSLGVYQLGLNILLLIVVFFLKRELIGIGTIINLVMVGFLIDFYTNVYNQLFSITLSLPLQIVYLVVGVVLVALGTSLYISPHLGSSPYDSLGPIISQLTKLPFKISRIIADSTFLIIGIIFGSLTYSYAGVGTVALSLCLGPLIVFWNKYSYQLVWKANEDEVTRLLKK